MVSPRGSLTGIACALTLMLALRAEPVSAQSITGFTEPYRTIDVAAVETGIVHRVHIAEGDTVQPDQVLAELDSEVHEALLAIAEQQMQARGRLQSAEAAWQLKRDRHKKLMTLFEQGHARQEEVDLARMEMLVAEAHVVSSREELLIRKLEFQKIEADLRRRSIRSPIRGVVTQLHKEVGEAVSPNSPVVATVVQLDLLLARFSMPGPEARRLKVGQSVRVHLADSKQNVVGVIERIAPVIDAESGTIDVQVRIENKDREYRSGERCSLDAVASP